MLHWLPNDGALDLPGGLRLSRTSRPTVKRHGVSTPALCVVLQGAKEVLLGNERYCYDAEHYLITAMALPIATRVLLASPEQPYIGLVLQLDPALVGAVIVEAGQLGATPRAVRAFDVSPLDGGLLDALARLVHLVDAPAADAGFLRPLIVREIVFRLLRSDQGERLRQIAGVGGQAQRIARALERLRAEYDRPLRVAAIARDLGMSVSSFHHHFKAVTALTPVQFQKQLRLQEARRLMLSDGLAVAGAAYRVGYRDASHFTRDYRRLFGVSPRRDVARLRMAPSARSASKSWKRLARCAAVRSCVPPSITCTLHERALAIALPACQSCARFGWVLTMVPSVSTTKSYIMRSA